MLVGVTLLKLSLLYVHTSQNINNFIFYNKKSFYPEWSGPDNSG